MRSRSRLVVLAYVAAALAGCVSGPCRIDDESGTHYSRRGAKYIPVNDWWTYKDAKDGRDGMTFPPVKITHVTNDEIDRVLAAEKAQSNAAAAAAEPTPYIPSARSERDRVNESIYWKDWHRWHDYYLTQGYTELEAQEKARRMVGNYGDW
jgi:hypothetical protein